MSRIDNYLKKSDVIEVARFINSDSGKRLIAFLRTSCPRLDEKNDQSLIRNAIGFDFWHRLIDNLESIQPPAKQDKQDDDQLE